MELTRRHRSLLKRSKLSFIHCLLNKSNIGSAILTGLLRATRVSSEKAPVENLKFVVTTKTENSMKRLQAEYAAEQGRKADLILLAFPSFLAKQVLTRYDMSGVLSEKLIISLLAGKTTQEVGGYFCEGEKVVRAMPNIAASICKSMTVIERGSQLSRADFDIIKWLFGLLGKVKYLSTDEFDAGAVLASASMAMAATSLNGILDGCMRAKLVKSDALEMAAQVWEGMSGLLNDGVHPAVLRESVSTPNGYATQIMLELEKKGVR
ncbi:hypothetical protein BDV12DRAFT_185942 [Aspergillus spectabilis]